MRILVVSHYYAAHGGGIESVTRQLLLAFREMAPQYRFTWAATGCDAPAALPGVANLPMAGSNAIEQKHGVPLPVWSWHALKQLAEAVKTHDAVWLQDTLYMGNIAAYLLAKCRRKPVVITQHVGQVPYQNKWLRRLVALANRFVALPMLRHAYRSVFVAAQVKSWFVGQGGRWVAPPLLVPNGVMHSIFKTVGAERRAMLREKYYAADQFTVLFVGRFVAKKGLPLLRELARELPEVTFLFAGRGAFDPAEWQLSNCRVIRDRVGAAIAELYQAADLLILPSYGEGLPLVIQEAAACGLPVLCAPDTAAADPQMAPLLNTAPLNPYDMPANLSLWRDQIVALRADDALRRQQGEDLAAFARWRWSWQTAAVDYAALFATMPQPQPTDAPLEDAA